MSELPRLYSFEELLASFPPGKMSARTLRDIIAELDLHPGADRKTMFLGIIYMTPYPYQTPHIPSHSLLNMLSCPRSSAVERSTSESGLRDG